MRDEVYRDGMEKNQALQNRVFLILVNIMVEKYPVVAPYSAEHDPVRDRVVIEAGPSRVELEPNDWNRSDPELRAVIAEKLHGVIRVSLP